MSDKELADIVCRALLGIVAGIRKKYELPTYQNIIIEVKENDSVAYAQPLAEKQQV